jgi:hypothetical protein
MTLHVKELGGLGEEADLIVDRMFNLLVKELRANYGKTVPTDDRLYDVELTVRNFIYTHCPEARGDLTQ